MADSEFGMPEQIAAARSLVNSHFRRCLRKRVPATRDLDSRALLRIIDEYRRELPAERRASLEAAMYLLVEADVVERFQEGQQRKFHAAVKQATIDGHGWGKAMTDYGHTRSSPPLE